jgi:hypothetical protein
MLFYVLSFPFFKKKEVYIIIIEKPGASFAPGFYFAHKGVEKL